LGLGNTTYYSSPKQIGALTTWSKISATDFYNLAIKTDGTLWSWGGNGGRLGLGDTADRSSPVQIGGLTNWSTIANGTNHSMAIG
jgi:alpha-tubulin suppressor-like RCC1 family protein